MSIRSRILGLMAAPALSWKERIRIVQTLETLEHSGPFTTGKFQGDESSECSALRKWVNQSPKQGVHLTPESLYTWVRKCPFKKELSEEWADRPIWD